MRAKQKRTWLQAGCLVPSGIKTQVEARAVALAVASAASAALASAAGRVARVVWVVSAVMQLKAVAT
jgi:hypothetical protein